MNAHVITRDELVRAFETWRKEGPLPAEPICVPDVNYGERCADRLLALVERQRAQQGGAA
jgi:hypothetical protein